MMKEGNQNSSDMVGRDKIERQINMQDNSLYNEVNQYYHYDRPNTVVISTELPFLKPHPYLSRQIFKKEDTGSHINPRDSCDLLTELEVHPHIVLLGDAGMGKSTEIEWICHNLKESGIFFPIYKRLSNYKKSQTYLTDLPTITQKQDESIVLVLDGMDEIDMATAIVAIRKFTDDHPKAKVLISCRSNAYSNTLSSFKEYYLDKLSRQQIQQYLQEELGHFSNNFLDSWRKRDSWNPNYLIENPFFLVRICKFVKDNGNRLPQSLGDVFEYLIETSLDLRKPIISGLEDTNHRKSCRKSLGKLAFVMESRGENVISETDLEYLIENPDERLVILAESSLIESQGDSWRFVHNNFQEYLAAKVLSQAKNFADIQQAIATKSDNRLNWSWTNTLSFLLGLWNNDAPLKRKLIDWLVISDLDALIKIASFEREKISSAERDDIFRRVFETCKKEDIAIGYRHYRSWDLAELGESANTIRFLIKELKTARTPTVLGNSLLLLNNMQAHIVPNNSKAELRALLLSTIYNVDKGPPSIRHSAMQTLLHLFDNLTNEEATTIVDTFFDSKNSEEREPTYILIEKYHLQINYMDRLLRRTIEINDDEWRGDTFLTNEDSFIKKCFEGLNTEDEIVTFFEIYPKIIERWVDDRRGSLPKSQLLEKAIVLVLSTEGRNRIFESMKQKLHYWMEYNRDIDKNLIIEFIDKFGFNLSFFQYCIDSKALPTVIIDLLNEQSVEYLAEKWKTGEVKNEQYLNKLIYWATVRKADVANLLINALNKVKKGIFLLPEIKPQKDDNQIQNESLLAEKALYFNKDRCITVIGGIFVEFGKETFDKNEIYKIEHQLSENDEEIDYRYPRSLIQFIDLRHSMTKDALLDLVDKTWGWISVNQVRAFILRNKKEIESNPSIELTQEEVGIVKLWCDNYWPTIDFQKQIINGTGVFAWYMVRYRFIHYPENVYLQMIGMGLQRQIGPELNIIDFIEKYTSVSFQSLKTRVLYNLKNGKVKGDDIDSHLKFIQDHKITEALGFLEDYIENKIETSNRHCNLALEVYIVLNGNIEYLYKLLKETVFLEGDSRESTLLNYFSEKNDIIFQKILQEKIRLLSEKDRKLRYAVCLFNAGNIFGLQFLVKYAKTEKTSPFPFQAFSNIKFENPKGISLLLSLFNLGHDQSIAQDDFNRISSLAKNVLLNLAACQQRKYFSRVQSSIRSYFKRHTVLDQLPDFLKKRLTVAFPETLKSLQYLLKDLEFQHYQKQEVTIEEAVRQWKRLSCISKRL